MERGSLLGLGRRLVVETRSLFDSLAWRFCRIKELAIAAISLAGEPNRNRAQNRWTDVELCAAVWCKRNRVEKIEFTVHGGLLKCHSDPL